MNLQQLEYIVAIDSYRHFVRPAETCFVMQVTLSMMVKKLEEEFGVIYALCKNRKMESCNWILKPAALKRIELIQDGITILPSLAIKGYRIFTNKCNFCHKDHDIDEKVLDLSDPANN